MNMRASIVLCSFSIFMEDQYFPISGFAHFTVWWHYKYIVLIPKMTGWVVLESSLGLKVVLKSWLRSWWVSKQTGKQVKKKRCTLWVLNKAPLMLPCSFTLPIPWNQNYMYFLGMGDSLGVCVIHSKLIPLMLSMQLYLPFPSVETQIISWGWEIL